MLETLKNILSEYSTIDVNTVTTETNLKQDLGLNSLELADLACAIEDEFDIEIPNRAVHTLITVGDVISFIEENQ